MADNGIFGELTDSFNEIKNDYLNGAVDRSVNEVKKESLKETGQYSNGWKKVKDSKGNFSLVNDGPHAYLAIYLEYGYHDGKKHKFVRPKKHIYKSIEKSI